MKRTLKLVLGPVIIVLTILAFSWYISRNPQVIEQLLATSGWLVFWIVSLYMLSFLALAGSLYFMLQLFKKRMPFSENFLLTIYSSIVNFFGPAQSGPGVRAVYLKVKHGIKIKQFVFATLLYYAWFGVISGLMVISPLVNWWQAIFASFALALGSYIVIRHYIQKNRSGTVASVSSAEFLKLFGLIGSMVALQIVLVTVVYYIELRSVDSAVSVLSAISYTGAANFALFVSLTPGAIGIREAFLVFSQQIHGVSNNAIIAASVLDRAAYLLVLAILFLIVAITHANGRFKKATYKSSGETV